MSASDKKKLRKEHTAELLTQKQEQQRSEAKKLKTYSIIFIVAMALIVCVAVGSLVTKWVRQSGAVEKRTIAATVGDYQMSSAELSYYYVDAINEFYSTIYGQSYADIYLQSMGLDMSVDLTKQINAQTNDTWANYFVDAALESAQHDLAMYNLAMKEGFKLSAEKQSSLDSELHELKDHSAAQYGSADKYLKSVYGYGADLESYMEYRERQSIADEYYTSHYDALFFDDAAMREYEQDKIDNYNSYDYTYAYLSYKDFLTGGTENEDGTKEYTEEENAAAREKLEAAAQQLVTATSVDELKEMIKTVDYNKETSQLAVNSETAKLHTSVSSSSDDLAKWLGDDARTEGEIGLVKIEAEVPQLNEDGTEKEVPEDQKEYVTNGYYVVIFQNCNDNTTLMSDVRHLLVGFENPVIDEATGEETYNEESKNAAKAEAERLLKEWQDGEGTQDSFIELVKANTDDEASTETGGLYENLYPKANYEPNFLDWAIDPQRKAGDTGIVETSYGYHIMYYVGNSEMTYRDHMISEELRNTTQDEWYTGALEAVAIVKKDMSKMHLDFITKGFDAK